MAVGMTNAVVGSGGGSVDWTVVTATAADVRNGRKFYNSSGVLVSGTAPVKAAATYNPGTSNQTIASGTFLTGTQTIKGDSDLKSSNIMKGVDIFGIVGSYEASENKSTSGSFTGDGSSSCYSYSGSLPNSATIIAWTLSGGSGTNYIYRADGLSSSGTGVYMTGSGPSTNTTSCSISYQRAYFSTSSPAVFGNGVTYYYNIIYR
ncbi:MAG: hypothetical protein IJL30_07155 [Clostridia bacterium]|nr:hypothetical protein [Clostridia bacterium]